jgi:hypothetical protein
VIPNCPIDALAFIADYLRWDPTKRITSVLMLKPPIHMQISLRSKIMIPIETLAKKSSNPKKASLKLSN